MLAYIITCVLQPQILHKLMVSPVLASELNSIEAKWMSIVKERHLMYRSIPNIALWDLYNLTTLKDQLHMRQMTQFFRLLQKNTHNSSVALSSSQKLKAIRPSLFSESASQSRGRYWLPYVSRLFSLYQIELVNTTTQFLSQPNADLEAPPVATLSNVAFGVGAAAVVTGIILLVTAPKKTQPTTGNSIQFVPVFDRNNAGATLLLRF